LEKPAVDTFGAGPEVPTTTTTEDMDDQSTLHLERFSSLAGASERMRRKFGHERWPRRQ
jgi:hypothetical protein